MITTQNKALAVLLTAAMSIPAFAQDAAEESTLEAKAASPDFRTEAPSKIVGGVSVVDVEQNQKKDHTLNALDNMTGFVGGWNGGSLWANDSDNDGGYLTIVDGVPRSAGDILAIEVKDVTFLKSAAAVVLYGSRAAKGAIIITTKHGEAKPLTIDFNANAGWSTRKDIPEYLGSAEYMTLYNKARQMDGLGAQYSDAEIYNYASGANPYRYSNLDFYSSDYVGKVKNRYDGTLQIQGGNERARFYTNISYFYEDDVLKVGQSKDNNNNRFSVRGNVDVNITDWIKAYIGTYTTFYNSRTAKGNYWDVASTFRPNRITPLIPLSMIDPNCLAALETVGGSTNIYNGCFLSGTTIDNTNLFADYYAAGYNKSTYRNFQFHAGVNIDLDRVLKGLSFHTQFATDYATNYTTSYDPKYAVFIPTWSSYNGQEVITGLTQEGTDEKTGNQNVSNSADNQTILFNADFQYRNTFNNVHNLEAMILASGWQKTISGAYHRTTNVHMGIRAAYDYDNRYYADFQAAEVHSSKLAPGHRNAFSPSLTLGWRISEDFFRGSKTVNNLELSASGTILHQDLDLSEYYMWRGTWGTGGWFAWGDGPSNSAFYPQRGENLDLTFIKRKEFSATAKGAFFNNMLKAHVDFFLSEMSGLPVEKPTMFPDYFTTYYPEMSMIPWINYNANRRTGLDFGVEFNKQFGDVKLNLGVVGTWYDTKATKRDEVYSYANLQTEGTPIDGMWGLKSAGLFRTDEEAAAWHDQSALGAPAKAGDIKYIDVNEDGVIDTNDRVYLAKGGWYGSPFMLGLNFSVSYKGFTLFALGTGNWGGHGTLAGNSYYYATGTAKYSAEMRNAWTPETAATATLPRLTTENGANNTVASDFWIYKTDAFRIGKIQLTYDMPESLMKKCHLNGAQIYVSGSNLFTIGKNRKILDRTVGAAPEYRFFNVGLSLSI